MAQETVPSGDHGQIFQPSVMRSTWQPAWREVVVSKQALREADMDGSNLDPVNRI